MDHEEEDNSHEQKIFFVDVWLARKLRMEL